MRTNANPILTTSLILLIVGLIVLVGVMAAVPPTSRDALVHHLEIPKLWINHGGMYEMPDLLFSYYPMNIDLLYLIPLYFGNDIIPKYIHLIFGMGTSFLIFLYLKKRTNLSLALLGVLIFFSTPIIVRLSISAYVDLGLVFFSWAAIYHLLEWGRSAYNSKRLIVSAIFCGLGLGTKYNGLIVSFLITLFIPLFYLRGHHAHSSNRQVKAILSAILFLSISLMLFSPWMIRNYMWTGNPIFPLYNKIFNKSPEYEAIPTISMNPWMQRKLIYNENVVQAALIPIRVFFQGEDDNPRLFDGKLSPILLLFPLLNFLNTRKRSPLLKREQLFLAFFSLFYLLYACFTRDMRVRYLCPIIPPLVILSVYGFRELAMTVQRAVPLRWMQAVNVLTGATIGLFLVQNAAYIWSTFERVEPVSYLSGSYSREAYLEKKLPEFSNIRVVNQLPSQSTKILALFLGKRGYYFKKKVVFGIDDFHSAVVSASGNTKIASLLVERGFTHLIIGKELFEKYAARNFNDKQIETIVAFLKKDCKPIYSKNGYILYELNA